MNATVRIPGSTLSTSPVITRDERTDEWVLVEDYAYLDGATGPWITVRAGFRFDLASIPRPLWWLIAPFELSIAAPLLHDALYRHGGALPRTWVHLYRTYTRKEADALFRRVMKAEGVSAWRRSAAYAAVRAFGGRAWGAARPALSPTP